MIQKVYSVYDSKSEGYLQPFYVKSRGEAIRGFTEIANDNNSSIGKWPADYTLFELGSFDTDTGKFDTLHTPLSCGVAIEFVKS